MKLFSEILKRKSLVQVLFGIYLAIVLRLTVFRPGIWPLHLFQGGMIDLDPLSYYVLWIRWRLWGAVFRELIGNIVGFMPFGGYLAWRNRKTPLWKILFAGMLFSLSIETAQFVLGVGVANPGDVCTNTLGALLGGWLIRESQWDARRRAD